MSTKRTLLVSRGIVTAANDGGLKLEGAETWANYSKWAELSDPLPAVGDAVEFEYETSHDKTYIRTLVITSRAEASESEEPREPVQLHPDAAPEQAPQYSARDRLMIRQSALKNAVALLSPALQTIAAAGKASPEQVEKVSTRVLEVADLYAEWLATDR